MIHDLLVRGVTVFPGSEHFEFVPGINVVVGGNDSGKSHLLKLCYTVARWSADGGKKSLPEKWAEEHSCYFCYNQSDTAFRAGSVVLH